MLKLFIRRTALFALLVIALLAAGEPVVRSLPNSYAAKHTAMQRDAGHLTTLILGSSHTYYGIEPAALGDSAFNLANVSQTPEYDHALLMQYIDSMPQLRDVILPVSYFTYRDPQLEKSDEWWRAVSYRTQMRLPVHPRLSPYNLEITDFSGYCAKLKNLVFPQQSNRCDSLGFGLGYSADTRSPSWQEQGEARALATTLPPSGRASEAAAVIGSTIGECKRRGIRCLLVTTPVWPTYRQHLDPGQLCEMRRLTDSLASRYGVKWLNLMDAPDFTEDDFHDVDHLTPAGAVRLASHLRPHLD